MFDFPDSKKLVKELETQGRNVTAVHHELKEAGTLIKLLTSRVEALEKIVDRFEVNFRKIGDAPQTPSKDNDAAYEARQARTVKEWTRHLEMREEMWHKLLEERLQKYAKEQVHEIKDAMRHGLARLLPKEEIEKLLSELK